MSERNSIQILLAAAALGLFSWCSVMSAQQPDAPLTPPPAQQQVEEKVTKTALDDLRLRIEAATDLTADQKQKALDSLQKAADSQKAADDFAAAKEDRLKQTAVIEEARKGWDEKLNSLPRAHWPDGGVELSQLEQELARKNQELIEAQTSLQQVEQSIATRDTRQRAIAERLPTISAAADAVTQGLARLATSTDPPLVVEAQRLQLLAEQNRLTAEPAALQTDAAHIAAEQAVNLRQSQRQFWTQQINLLKSEIERWTKEISNRKRDDSEGRRNIAIDRAEAAPFQELKEIYEQNAAIVSEELRVHNQTERIKADLERSREQLNQVTNTDKELRSREGKIRSSTAFGIRLREERRKLQELLHNLPRQISDRTDTYVQANLDALKWRDEHVGLDDIDAQVQRALDRMKAYNVSDDELQEIEERFRPAYVEQLSYLNQLEAAYDTYINSLDQLNEQQEQLVKAGAKFQEYINSRVLWIPSERPLTLMSIADDYRAFIDLLRPATWQGIGRLLLKDVQRAPLWYVFASFVWGAMLVTYNRQRQQIRTAGQRASSRLNTSMGPTWESLIWTFVHSAVIPLPLLFLSWRCLQAGGTDEQSFLARNLFLLSLWIWWLDFVRQACRPRGLGANHFQWAEDVNRTVSTQAASFLMLASPLAFVIAVLHSRSEKGGNDSLERLCWITIFVLLAYSLHRLTSPEKGILREIKDANGEPSRWGALGALWHALAVATPLILAGLTVAGYTYAAQQLCLRLAETLVLVSTAIFMRALLFRWLSLRQRRLAIERSRQIRAALAQSEGEGDGSAAAVIDAQEARTNLVEVSTQSRRLLNTTIVISSLFVVFVIWREVLPALGYWDSEDNPFKIATYFRALILVILMTTAARNVPGLLEITVLEQLPLDRSTRYAVGTLTRYVILVVGISMISRTMGIGWDQVQWLAAALTFGLGFGLQDIFANFISGLIILFEQPVRVGDVVTIDSVTGSVTKIRIRSTTIQNADRKEYIVPNKEFITSKLLNWTLTDTTNRIVINVGVGMDSDPEQVRAILLDVVRSQPLVLTDPAPNAVFDGFGEWSLKFTVMACLPSMDQRLETIHMLHTRILKALQDAGIEIPYPHRVEIQADENVHDASHSGNGAVHKGPRPEVEEAIQK